MCKYLNNCEHLPTYSTIYKRSNVCRKIELISSFGANSDSSETDENEPPASKVSYVARNVELVCENTANTFDDDNLKHMKQLPLRAVMLPP